MKNIIILKKSKFYHIKQYNNALNLYDDFSKDIFFQKFSDYFNRMSFRVRRELYNKLETGLNDHIDIVKIFSSILYDPDLDNFKGLKFQDKNDLSDFYLRIVDGYFILEDGDLETYHNKRLTFNSLTNIIDGYDKKKKLFFLLRFFYYFKSSLDVRSQNILLKSKKVRDTCSYESALDCIKYIFDNPQIESIRNLGVKSVPVLKKFSNKIITGDFLIENDKTIYDNLNKFILSFLLDKEIEKLELHGIPNNKVSIFKIFDIILRKNKYYNIWSNCNSIYENKNISSTEEYSQVLKLTKERVRQISKEIFDKKKMRVHLKINDLTKFDNLIFQITKMDEILNSINLNKALISIDTEFCDEINRLSNTSFTPNFILLLIYYSCSELNQKILNTNYRSDYEDYELKINDRLSGMGNHHLVSLYLKNYYIVNNQLDISSVYILKFLKLIFLENLKIRREEVGINIQKFIKKSINKTASLNIKNVEYFVEIFILIKEKESIFKDVSINQNKYNKKTLLLFKKRGVRPYSDYIYKVLEKIDEPSRVDVIYHNLCEMFPEKVLEKHKNINYDKIKAFIGGNLRRDDKRFIFFGRTSTYGLKKWEEEGRYKGGTIRSISLEYICKFENPVHIIDIFKHVKKYRDTNPKSIQTNIRLNVNTGDEVYFKTYNGYFISSSKNVNKKYLKINRTTLRTLSQSIIKLLKNGLKDKDQLIKEILKSDNFNYLNKSVLKECFLKNFRFEYEDNLEINKVFIYDFNLKGDPWKLRFEL